MEATSLTRAPSLPELIRLALIGALLLLAGVGWLVTDERMAGMDLGPGTDPGTLGFWVTAWVVMMGAMMFPSISPMVLMYVRIQEGKRDKGRQDLRLAPRRASSVAISSPGQLAALPVTRSSGWDTRYRRGSSPGTTPVVTWPGR